MITTIRSVKKYLRAEEKTPALPRELVIETTNRCNMNCIMCPREMIKSPLKDMDMPLFFKIIDEAVEFVENISLSFRGEPFLNENIFKMIDYVRSKDCAKKMKISLSTNASLLTQEKIEKILKSGLNLLTIGIDAVTAQTYSKIRKGADFNTIVRNIKNLFLCKKKMKSDLSIMLQIIPMKENYFEINKFTAYWKKQPFVKAIKRVPFSTRGGLVNDRDNQIGRKELLRKNKCFRLWKGLTIYSNGSVVPCCFDFIGRYIIGDLNCQSIRDVWSGERMLELRRMHAKGDFKNLQPCENCEVPTAGSLRQIVNLTIDDFLIYNLLTEIR